MRLPDVAPKGVALRNANDYHYVAPTPLPPPLTVSMRRIAFALLLAAFAAAPALASDDTFSLVIRDHRFEPAELVVPVGVKIKLVVENRDATPEEFESHELNREKMIAGKSSATIWIGPLKPGRYPYVGEFNEKTARGVIVAR